MYPIRSTKTAAISRCLDNLSLKFGAPETIVCDRGTCFTSDEFQRYWRQKGINVVLNSPRLPQANGMVESVNHTTVPVIQVEMKCETGWDRSLKKVQYDLNSSINKTTKTDTFPIADGI